MMPSTLLVVSGLFHALFLLPCVASPPTVVLDGATITGIVNGSVAKYLGIPFAQPPIGDLRLRAPQSIPPYSGSLNATEFGNQCIQQSFPALILPDDVPAATGQYISQLVAPAPVPQSEDCLNLNVIVPANATRSSMLPVAVWIYGGGFQIGSNAIQPGEVVVARSIEIGHPIVYVAMNYRLSAFGFLGGKEVKKAAVANLGLLDQREALRWIQKYIPSFGGDPSKVMIWGESAGSTSVAHHMLANGGHTEGLFRAGFMESGSPLPTGFVDNAFLQRTYDGIVDDTGCSGSNDTLSCLRRVSAEDLKAAMDKTPNFLSFQQVISPWYPRADGGYVSEPPQHQLLKGGIADIPFVNGDDKDEGSLFSFPTLNLTTDEEFLDYIQDNFYANTSHSSVARILDFYPSNPALGSPFDTGNSFSYSSQYKRMSAFQGDYLLQAPRRLLFQVTSGKRPTFSYLSNVNRVHGIGAAHGTELANIYGGGDIGDYIIRFAATLDPNGDGAAYWPRYTKESPRMLVFSDTSPALQVISDTYRAEQMAYLTKLSLADPF